MNAAAVYAKCDALAAELLQFYCDSVGKPFPYLEEFCLLVEWSDAIDAAINVALSLRDWISDKEYCDMREECNIYLECNKNPLAR